MSTDEQVRNRAFQQLKEWGSEASAPPPADALKVLTAAIRKVVPDRPRRQG